MIEASIQQFTITYNMNSVGATALPQETYSANTLVTFAGSVQTNDPATALDFWTDGGGTVRQPGSTLILTQNVTLTATYYNKYRITYLTNNSFSTGTQTDTAYYSRNEQATIKNQGLIVTNDFTTVFTSWTEVGSNATRMPGDIVTMTASRTMNAFYTVVLANSILTYRPNTGTIKVFNSLKTQIFTFNTNVNIHGFIIYGPNRTATRMSLTNSYYEKYYAPPKQETMTNDFFYVTTRISNASVITNHNGTTVTSAFNTGTDTLVIKTSTAGANQFIARNATLLTDILSARIALDPSGNVYVSGNHNIGTNLAIAYDSSGIAFSPVIDSNTATNQSANAHIIKYNANGNILGVLTFEGTLNNIIYDVFATSTNVYVAFRNDGGNNPMTVRNGTFIDNPVTNTMKGLVMKITGVGNNQNAFVWVVGVRTGGATDRGTSVSVDASDNVFAMFSTSAITTLPLFDTTSTTARYTAPQKTSNYPSIFAKYNSSGVLQWKCVFYTTNAVLSFIQSTIDASGNGLVVFQSTAACEVVDEFGTRKALQMPSGITQAVFLVKISITGAFVSYNNLTNSEGWNANNLFYLDQYYYLDCIYTGIVTTNSVTITDLPTPSSTFTQTGLFTATGNSGCIKLRFNAATMLPELIGYYTN